jgi:hypothetical protein
MVKQGMRSLSMGRKWVGWVAQGILIAASALFFGTIGLLFMWPLSEAAPALSRIGAVLGPLGFGIGAVFGVSLAIVLLAGCRTGVGCLVRLNRNNRLVG